MALRQFVDQDVPGPRRDYVGYGRHVPKVRWPDGARVAGLRDFLEYALDKGDVWFARRIDIANWWIDHHKEFEA